MCDPTEQDYHSEARHDDAAIGNQDRLLRHCRVPIQVVPCERTNGHRLSSQSFSRKPGEVGISVDLECLLHKDGKTFVDRVGVMPDSVAMAVVVVEDVRTLKAGVAWTPKPEEDLPGDYAGKSNPYHGEVVNLEKKDERKLERHARLLWAQPSYRFSDDKKDVQFAAWVPS